MPIQKDNTAQALADLHDELARRLLRAAVLFQTEHRRRVSVPNTGVRRRRVRDTVAGKKGSSYTVYPNPSKPGEYPHLITGQGRSGSAVYEPDTVGGVVAAGLVIRIGVTQAGRHMAILERYRQRKGLIDTAHDLRGQLAAVLAKGG